MSKKCAVFTSKGLGDGLIFLLVSNNLKINGFDVVTYHEFLKELEPWFGGIKIEKYPRKDKICSILSKYDLVIINTDSREINEVVQKQAIKLLPKSTYLLHATTCKGKNLPGNYYLDRQKTLVSNLYDFCENELKLKNLKKENGINPPDNLTYRKYKKRIIIHPTSTTDEKNWPMNKYIKLSHKLKKAGFNVSFILPKEERSNFLKLQNLDIDIPHFENLNGLATFIYESGYMIGNDSGIGHLASSMKIPTFIIFPSKRKMLFWRPDFFLGDTILPWPVIPNIKGIRWREKYWKNFIEVSRVYRKFKKRIQRTSSKKLKKLSLVEGFRETEYS